MGSKSDTSSKGGGHMKRSATSDDAPPEQGKRRAAYIPRACDSCRKRKGRCDGARPCRFCHGRRQECTYSMTMSDWRNVQTSAVHGEVPGQQPKDTAWMPDAITSLSSLVMNLHQQVASLNARIEQANSAPTTAESANATNPASTPAQACVKASDQSPQGTNHSLDDEQGSRAEQPSIEDASAESQLASGKYQPMGSFHGPTSPDFSLNMAQKQACAEKASPNSEGGVTVGLPSIDDQQSDEEDEDERSDNRDSSSTRQDPCAGKSNNTQRQGHGQGFQQLQPRLRFEFDEIPQRLSLRESLRLLRVYEEVVGPFHPIVDIAVLSQHLEVLYHYYDEHSTRHGTPATPGLDKDKYLVLSLVLSIALFAENTPSEAKTGRRIFHACQEAINCRLVMTPTNLNHVVLALMTGLCYFFDGATQSAWRVCGIAGSMLMELGLHNREVVQHVLSSERMRAEVANITCSILVLDRQWSAATGLPPHFRESTFEQNLQAAVNNPYLKAMMAFLIISDKVSGTIATALQGKPYEDDDALELVNFQIYQWRSNAIKTHAPTLLEHGYSSSCQAPSWAVLLSLRANSVRGMLLRPFFFPNSKALVSQKDVKAALDVISDTINTLVTLDKATDIYRKQHPYYQHILAGACALLSLVISAARQSRLKLTADASESVMTSIRHNFWSAMSLASTYSASSRMSRRLLRRLELMKQPLVTIGVINRTDDVTRQQPKEAPSLRTPTQRQTLPGRPEEQNAQHQGQHQRQASATTVAPRPETTHPQPGSSQALAGQSQMGAEFSASLCPYNVGPLSADALSEDPSFGSPPLHVGLGGEFAWFMDSGLANAGANMNFPNAQGSMSGMEDAFGWGSF
ncbi:hypothetical protein NLU13_9869 [Sarocladium strictum]|uniref:Zn(2)-C6 fungal-type domain-containing protein n=1 Tax=Sarocladium strictum TaxID=5046 RepID=A0AA39L3H0_SARSR|nr:hypothetical protein NLU13_9869 [Sarocladium strictum]